MNSGNKKIALIQSYCNSQLKIDALQDTVNKLKELNVDICLFSAIKLPKELTDQVNYYIYSDNNPVLHYPEKAFNFWLWQFYKSNPDRKFYLNKMFSDYGWTVLNQVKHMSFLVKDLGYDYYFLVNYDLKFDDTVIFYISNPNTPALFKHQKHTTIFDGTLIFSVLTKRELDIICNEFNKSDFITTNYIPENYFINKVGYGLLVNELVHDVITVEGQQKEQVFNEMPNNDLFKLFIQNKKRLLIHMFDINKKLEIKIKFGDFSEVTIITTPGENEFINFGTFDIEKQNTLTISTDGNTYDFSYLFSETAPVCWFSDTDEQFSGTAPHISIENDMFVKRLTTYN
jgi:hypothetical protein